MAGISTKTECPVCNEDYVDPKLLPCNHLICRKCTVKWLKKAGQQGGCPLCRVPILSPGSQSGEGNLPSLVDALPTDLMVVGLVESCKVLNSRHVCMHCDRNTAASSFCLQCNMKLCKVCAKGHKNIPVLKNHVIETLSDLTPERLAEINRSMCRTHDDKMAELYCFAHEELICMLCGTTTHRLCEGVKVIDEAARDKRNALKWQAQRLREKETAMRTTIKNTTDKFKAMRRKVKDAFDDLQQCVERKHQEVSNLIQVEEDKMALAQLDKDRAALKSHAGVIDNLVASAPDDSLLDMASKMRSRLNDLEQQAGRTDGMEVKVVDALLDFKKLAQLKLDVADLDKPRRAALAKILKVGDRVKRGPDWVSGNEDERGQGTVTAIPSQIRTFQAQGYVDVMWDHKRDYPYRMGRYDKYDLDLV